MAYLNPLTQLHNRCSFEENLIRSLNTIGEYNRQLSIIIIDFYGFKKVNDTLGHDTGVLLLQQYSLIIKKYLRH